MTLLFVKNENHLLLVADDDTLSLLRTSIQSCAGVKKSGNSGRTGFLRPCGQAALVS